MCRAQIFTKFRCRAQLCYLQVAKHGFCARVKNLGSVVDDVRRSPFLRRAGVDVLAEVLHHMGLEHESRSRLGTRVLAMMDNAWKQSGVECGHLHRLDVVKWVRSTFADESRCVYTGASGSPALRTLPGSCRHITPEMSTSNAPRRRSGRRGCP